MSAKRSKKALESSKAVESPKSVSVETLPKPKVEKIKTPKVKKASEKPEYYIIFDYPAENEVVSGLHYAIRIGASEGPALQICIDDSEWQACRHSAGYWWFDWGYFTPGVHTLTARLINEDGKQLKKSEKRKITVV